MAARPMLHGALPIIARDQRQAVQVRTLVFKHAVQVAAAVHTYVFYRLPTDVVGIRPF